MAKCQFKAQYKDLERNLMVDFYCDEAELLASGLCIFHDKYYLEDKAHIDEHSAKIKQKLQHLIKDAVYNKKPLFCIGFHLLDFDISKIEIDKVFTIPVYFSHAIFFGETSFFGAKFEGEASFYSATFYGETGFSEATFNKRTDFDYAVFHKETDFAATHFHGNISFNNAIFFEISIFIFANFSICYGETCLDNTDFHGETDFSEATLHGETDFSGTTFHKKATFNHTTFNKKVYFFQTNFLNQTYFSGKFTTDTDFYKAYFENKEKVVFDIDNMHHVSFINTDIVGIRFSDNTIWGEEAKDRFRILDERRLEDIYKKKIDEEKNDEDKNDDDEEEDDDTVWREKVFNLGSIIAEYRNLRENYEYRRRYDEAGQFFIREMELKRNYTYVPILTCTLKNRLYDLYRKLTRDSSELPPIENKIRKSNWFGRNISLTGLYYHFSHYGESIARPTIIGAITVALSTLFWLTQKDPNKDPSFSQFVGAYWILINHNSNYLERAFERSFADFLPLLSLPTGISPSVIDYITKIFGGALTFGLLVIAFRRKFERKYTR